MAQFFYQFPEIHPFFSNKKYNDMAAVNIIMGGYRFHSQVQLGYQFLAFGEGSFRSLLLPFALLYIFCVGLTDDLFEGLGPFGGLVVHWRGTTLAPVLPPVSL